MAKLYTRAEWDRLMRNLPPEDRTPYDQSPDIPEYTVRPTTTAAPTTTATPTTGTPRPTTAAPTTGTPRPTTETPTTGTPRPGTTTTTVAPEQQTTPTPAPTTQAPQNFTGDGTAARPLFLNGQLFTGERNGIKYENGRFVDATRADVLQANREAGVVEEIKNRASQGWQFDIANRPEGNIDENFIIYWSWVGGATTGQWRQYRAALTPDNMEKYGSRVFAGETQQEGISTGGANALTNQPLQIRDADGKVIGYELNGRRFLSQGFSGGTTSRPSGTTVAPGGTTTLVPGTTTPGGSGGTTTRAPGTTLAPTLTTTMAPVTTSAPGTKRVVSTYTDPTTGDVFSVYEDGSRMLLSKGTRTQEQATERRSAFQLLRQEFNRYGLGDLVGDVENLVISGVSPAEFAIELRKTPVYEKRFSGNKARISKGLQALSEAEYISLEDQYQDVMRRYGLPKSYYEPGQYGIQSGFQKLIENDVSSVELEDRIQTAQNRVLFANPEVGIALRTFYPNITNGDVLAYVLDPENALAQIKRRITAAEVGSTAVQMGLATNVTDAEYLARYGVTKEQAQAGYRTIAETLPRGGFLGEIYAEQGLGPYTQQTAEREVFNVPGAAEAAAKRRRLAEMETAQFSGQAGLGTLARERAGQF